MIYKVYLLLVAAAWPLFLESAAKSDNRGRLVNVAKPGSIHSGHLRAWLTTKPTGVRRTTRDLSGREGGGRRVPVGGGDHRREPGGKAAHRREPSGSGGAHQRPGPGEGVRQRRDPNTGPQGTNPEPAGPQSKPSTKPCEWLPEFGTTKHIGQASSKKSAYATQFNDPKWKKQWYMHDYRTVEGPVLDLNVVPVYQKGIDGKGVKVAVVDDGVNHEHPDLKDNYALEMSYDALEDKAGSAMPAKIPPLEMWLPWTHETHGTMAAGVVGMRANNGVCGVGIAHGATIIGVKALGAKFTAQSSARALTHKLDVVDIYSNSWGPSDDGQTMVDMADLVKDALLDGVLKGRGGKGVVYVFAAGNGKEEYDNCAADDYINSPQVVAIAAASPMGKRTTYSEPCAAVFAATYAQASHTWGPLFSGEAIVSSTAEGGCVTSFGYTSSAAPQATGIIALVLQAKCVYR